MEMYAALIDIRSIISIRRSTEDLRGAAPSNATSRNKAGHLDFKRHAKTGKALHLLAAPDSHSPEWRNW